jgi:repressor LexA
MPPSLTRRQQEIYDYLQQHFREFDYPPTLDALCQALGLRSRGSMHKHVHALVDAGLVEPLNGQQRGIRLATQSNLDENTVPMLGVIAAGRPIEALPHTETITVPPALRSNRPCYALKVKGDSMIEEGILDGDWIVVEQRDSAPNGAIVVALIDNNEATLKRIEQTAGRVILHPANASMQPLSCRPDQVRIQGVLVGQMRAYN